MIEYSIRDPSGALIATHVRVDEAEGKRFYWRLPDGELGLGGLPVAELPLYGIARDLGRSVVLVEGEKACEALTEAGIVAVGSVTGAQSTPSAAVLAELAGKRVYCWPDADAPGRAHMQRIAARLGNVAAAVRWIEPPADVPKGWDAADALAATGAEYVRELIRDAGDPPDEPASNHSSGPDAPSERMKLPFITAAELTAELPEDTEWIAEPWIAAGTVTLLNGGPKAGKSTLYAHLIRAALNGGAFLGERVRRTAVVLLTEQGPASLRPLLARAGLTERADLSLLLWRDARGPTWPAVVEQAVERCRMVGAALLVVDTLAQFAGLSADAENDAGAALDALRPLQAAAADGVAVLVIHHERKGAGSVGEAGRGSSAIAGAVDAILALRRGDGESRPTIRHLHGLSRFDETPGELVIELTADGYVALGEPANFAIEEAKAAVRAAIGPELLTTTQLVEATGLKRTAVYAALTELAAAGEIERRGKGSRGDPFLYVSAADRPDFSSDVLKVRTNESAGAADVLEAARQVFGDMLAPATPTDLSAMVPRADA